MMPNVRWTCTALQVALACAGLGCGAEDDGVAGGGGEVKPPWDSQCVATFTESFDVVDGFGDVEWRVKAGGRYLLSDLGGFGVEATVLYLSSRGPIEMEIDVDDGAALPFTSSCSDDAVQLVGVFADTTVYMDEGKTMPACTLSAGSTHAGGLNYALVSELFAKGGTYQVEFGGLADACGGLTSGYVEAKSVSLGSTEYTVIPIATLLGPVAM
jgi:hypothetical protein